MRHNITILECLGETVDANGCRVHTPDQFFRLEVDDTKITAIKIGSPHFQAYVSVGQVAFILDRKTLQGEGFIAEENGTGYHPIPVKGWFRDRDTLFVNYGQFGQFKLRLDDIIKI